MSASEHDADELLDLLNELWNRGPSRERVEAIEHYVETHGPEAYERLLEYAALDADIAASLSSVRAFQSAITAVTAERIEGAQATPAFSATAPLGGSSATEHGLRRFYSWAPAIVATLLIALGATLWFGSSEKDNGPAVATRIALERPSQPVARIVGEQDAEWTADRSGDMLTQGQELSLSRGTAQISLACGADLLMQAPCQITLVADDVVNLHEGRVTAQAAEWATGFVVETKSLRVTHLGTRSEISTNEAGVTEAHALEGSMLAVPMKAIRAKHTSMLVKQGQAIRVSLPKSTIDLIAAKQTRFIDHLPTFRPLQPIRIWNTGFGQQIGSTDPHWEIVAGDANNGPYPRPATVAKGVPEYLDNMPDASQWISVSSKLMANPDSVHTFETKFDLSGYDLDSVRVVGLFLVDDAINSLRINGTNVPFQRWESSWDFQDFQRFRAIEISEGFVPGENTISIELYNSPSRPENRGNPNPIGMRVEWQAFGCETR